MLSWRPIKQRDETTLTPTYICNLKIENKQTSTQSLHQERANKQQQKTSKKTTKHKKNYCSTRIFY